MKTSPRNSVIYTEFNPEEYPIVEDDQFCVNHYNRQELLPFASNFKGSFDSEDKDKSASNVSSLTKDARIHKTNNLQSNLPFGGSIRGSLDIEERDKFTKRATKDARIHKTNDTNSHLPFGGSIISSFDSQNINKSTLRATKDPRVTEANNHCPYSPFGGNGRSSFDSHNLNKSSTITTVLSTKDNPRVCKPNNREGLCRDYSFR